MNFKKLSFARAGSTLTAILFAVCVIARVSDAQEVSAAAARLSAISGTLFDVKESVIPNAVVTLVNCETKEVKQTMSSEEGRFLFEGLERGIYDLTAEWPHFKKHERLGIHLEHSDRQHFNLTLEVQVTSHFDPPPGPESVETAPAKLITSLSNAHTASSPHKSRKSVRRKERQLINHFK